MTDRATTAAQPVGQDEIFTVFQWCGFVMLAEHCGGMPKARFAMTAVDARRLASMLVSVANEIDHD